MKILVVAPTPFFSDRGTHIRILEEARGLEKLGHKITIATYHIGKEIDRNIKTKIDVRRIRRLLFWYKKLEAGPDWQKVILDLMLIRKVFYLARTERPDVIHAHLHEGVLIGWVVQKILFWRRIKLVADFHGSLVGEMRSHGYLKLGIRRIFSLLERSINKMGDYAIASSWEETEDIKKGRRDGKIETVPDGASLFEAEFSKDKEEIKKDWEIPEDKFVVGYAGGLVPTKGVDYFFSAIRIILERRKDVFFLVGGFPPNHTREFIKNNHFEANARLVSPLDYFKLGEFLRVLDVGVDPKGTDTGEASGKMLNYMGAGLPVVCFEKTNNRKYLEDGGYFASPGKADSLAEKIIEAIDRKEESLEKGQFNRQRVARYSWEKTAQKINRIYESLK